MTLTELQQGQRKQNCWFLLYQIKYVHLLSSPLNCPHDNIAENMGKRLVNFGTPLNIERLNRIRNLLIAEPLTSQQLSLELRVTKPALFGLLKNLSGNFYISNWIVSPGSLTPKYSWGNGVNAPRPSRASTIKPEIEKASNSARGVSRSAVKFGSSSCGNKFKPQHVERDISVRMLFGDLAASKAELPE